MYSVSKYLVLLINVNLTTTLQTDQGRRGASLRSNNNKQSSGLPHSEISGSKPILGSPELIAEYHVLHRLLLPRHPPNALLALDLIQRKTVSTPTSKLADASSIHLYGHSLTGMASQKFFPSIKPHVWLNTWLECYLTWKDCFWCPSPSNQQGEPCSF